jgi:hypothetical protein
MPQPTPEEAVNAYLMERYEVCLEEVLEDAIEGNPRPDLAEGVQVTAKSVDQFQDDDGYQCFEGTLTLKGVRYEWRAAAYTEANPDGRVSVANVAEFRPVEWEAKVEVNS